MLRKDCEHCEWEEPGMITCALCTAMWMWTKLVRTNWDNTSSSKDVILRQEEEEEEENKKGIGQSDRRSSRKICVRSQVRNCAQLYGKFGKLDSIGDVSDWCYKTCSQ